MSRNYILWQKHEGGVNSVNEKITILIKNSEYDKACAAAKDMYKGEYDAFLSAKTR